MSESSEDSLKDLNKESTTTGKLTLNEFDEGTQYDCDQCERVFTSAIGLRTHQKSHVSKVFLCFGCDKTFCSDEQRQRHRGVHFPQRCGVSRSTFVNSYRECRSRAEPHQINPPLPSQPRPRNPPLPDVPPPLQEILQVGGANADAVDANSLVIRNAAAIKSYRRVGQLLDIFNFNIGDSIKDIVNPADQCYEQFVKGNAKVNASPGFILRNLIDGSFRYFHSSANNHSIFPKPRRIDSKESFNKFIKDIIDTDLNEWIRSARPNTSWVVHRLTNLTIYIYKLYTDGHIGYGEHLPIHLRKIRSIICLDKNPRTREPFRDKLCFFRALAIHTDCLCNSKKPCRCRHARESTVKKLLLQWNVFSKLSYTPSNFPGVTMDDITPLSQCFQVNINIYRLNSTGVAMCVYDRRAGKFNSSLNLCQHGLHFCYIKNINGLTKSFVCRQCDQSFTRASSLSRHGCKGSDSRLKFPTGCYRPKQTIFQEIYHRTGIKVEEERTIYPYRITYDIETYMDKDDIPLLQSEKMNFQSHHRLMSVSVCSNIPQYTEPKCFISNGSDEELIETFMTYLELCHEQAANLMTTKFCLLTTKLEHFAERESTIEAKFEGEQFSSPRHFLSRSIDKLIQKFNAYLSVVPVVGFNSGSYDLNVMKGPLIKFLHLNDRIKFVIKRQSKLQCIQTEKFKFLDMMNFLTPGTSYAKYLKTFAVSASKGFFPYEYITSLAILREEKLPPHSAFFSNLTKQNITEEEYAFCQRVWTQNNMSSMKDFLIWYNNLDVKPFLEAIDKQSTIYSSRGIDMLKDNVSVPGLSVQWKFNLLHDSNIDIPLITIQNSDLYRTVKENIVGGPSIIFHRYHERGETKIRLQTFRDKAKTCKHILGFDANALYLWSISQKMPVGSPIRRRAQDNFIPHFSDSYGRMAWGWLEDVARKENIRILHKFNSTEFRVGQHGLPVDGYHAESSTVFQFHGCAFHGHSCELTSHLNNKHPFNDIPFSFLSADTLLKESYIREHGFTLRTIRECEWRQFVKHNEETKSFVKQLLHRDMSHSSSMSQQQMITAITQEKFFGLIECDIHVPQHLHQKFSEMSPIFKNTQVSRSDLLPHMQRYAHESGKLAQPQRMLIGSMFGKKILLFSPLVKWYLDHGLVITKVYQIVQYKAEACFERFGESVTTARREGDSDPSKALLADISKLIGNSVYGKTITNKEKHQKVSYHSDARKASLAIASKSFLSVDEITKDFYEVISHKTSIILDTPVVLGFCILQYAKLRMLQFYYDCIDKYIDRTDFQYCEMDTDSAYMALSDDFDNVIKPKLKDEFWLHYSEWFPRLACPKHHNAFIRAKTSNLPWNMEECCKKINKYDQRTPGLFKLEYSGVGCIALNSKTYFCWTADDTGDKYTSKGLNKKQNQLTKDQYMSVLLTKTPVAGINTGFLRKDNQMYTYSQERFGLSYFYAKRRLLLDGVSTIPIHL